MTTADRLRWLLRGLGQTLITLGVVLLLFCVYELKVTSLYTSGQQHDLESVLRRTWAVTATVPTPTRPGEPPRLIPELGKGFARIYLPSLGRGEVHVVVEGVGHEDRGSMSRSTQSARDAMVFALFGVLLCVACKVPEPRGDIVFIDPLLAQPAQLVLRCIRARHDGPVDLRKLLVGERADG